MRYLLGLSIALACLAQPAPTVDAARQALNKKWQKLRPDYVAERNVLFQDVRAGRPDAGSYPFQVTVLIRDYEAGYPPNHYYGKTCVSRITAEVYTLSLDQFGAWDAQGRMTPNMSDTQCKNNPGAGVSSIPLATLQGAAAPAGQPAPVQMPPVAAATAGGAGSLAIGAYECWSSGSANLMLNFKITGANQYVGSDGKSGSVSFDARSQRVSFHGGLLDGVLPAGFYFVYYSPQGRPTVSLRNPGGSETAFCQKR